MKKNLVLIALMIIASVAMHSCQEEGVVEDPIKETFCFLESIEDSNGQDILRLSYNSNNEIVGVVNEEGSTVYPADFWSNIEGSSAVQTTQAGLIGDLSFVKNADGSVSQRILADRISGVKKYTDYVYDGQGRLIGAGVFKQSQGNSFIEKIADERYVYVGDNIFKREVYSVQHSQGSNPRPTLTYAEEFTYDNKNNPLKGTFINGAHFRAYNKNNIVSVRETSSGGTVTKAKGFSYNSDQFPTIAMDGFGNTLETYSYTSCIER